MPAETNLKDLTLRVALEISRSSAVLAATVAGFTTRPTVADLERLAAHAAQLERAWVEFRRGCESAAKDNSFTW